MYPILFSIAGITVKTSWFIWLLSIVLFIVLTKNRGERLYGIDRTKTSEIAVTIFAGAIAGSAVYIHVWTHQNILGVIGFMITWMASTFVLLVIATMTPALRNWTVKYSKTVKYVLGSAAIIIALSFLLGISQNTFGSVNISLSSGITILFGMVAIYVAAYFQNVNYGTIAECVTIPAAISVAFLKLGCLAEGCCRGIVSRSPMAFLLYSGENAYRIPYPLIEFAFIMFCVFLLLKIEKILFRKHKQGKCILLTFAAPLYGFFMISTDFLREDAFTSLELGAFILLTCAGSWAIILLVVYPSYMLDDAFSGPGFSR